MYDLTAFGQEDLDRCGEALTGLREGASSMEEAANRITQHLFDNTINPENGEKACAMVRFYKTHPYEDLNGELRAFAQGILGHPPDPPDMKCLVLLATAGEQAEWNSRTASVGHKAIPLPDEAFVSKIPMISRLVSQFGLDVNAVIRADPNLLTDLEQKRYNAFHVAEAVGSPYIPAQKDFVIPYGIRSVLGFGGMLTTGELFAVIMFAKVQIPRATADRANVLALRVKEVVQAFASGRIFAD
jgi:hypothetical protein